jgi:hypothetical protein
MDGMTLRQRKQCCKQAYATGAKVVAESARKWWTVPSDGSGHSLDDWLKAIEEWAAGSMYADMPVFPGETAGDLTSQEVYEAVATLFPGFPCSDLMRHHGLPGKFWLCFKSDSGVSVWSPAVMVRVKFLDSDFVGMDRQEAVSHVKDRVLDQLAQCLGQYGAYLKLKVEHAVSP